MLRPVLLAISLCLLACDGRQPSASPAPAGAPPANGSDTLATMNGFAITLSDVYSRFGNAMARVEAQHRMSESRVVLAALDSIVKEELFAKESQKRSRSVADLIAAEAPVEPSDMDVALWYQQNQGRLGGRTLEQLRPQIVAFLREEKRKMSAQKLEARLRREYGVRTLYEPFRVPLNNDGAPALGRKGAPVTVVEFSDFQCPYCRNFSPVLKQLQRQFGDSVYLVYRQYPIQALHPQAPKAAEASLCAHEQGKFWEMHDALFADQAAQSVPELKDRARALGMDQRKFATCLDSGKYEEQVRNDLVEGDRSGVTGTPAIFVNGMLLEGGAVPYDVVAAAVQKELQRVVTR